MAPIGKVNFIDGATRDVFVGLDGRQFVFDGDWVPIHGFWLVPVEGPADNPAIVVCQCGTAIRRRLLDLST